MKTLLQQLIKPKNTILQSICTMLICLASGSCAVGIGEEHVLPRRHPRIPAIGAKFGSGAFRSHLPPSLWIAGSDAVISCIAAVGSVAFFALCVVAALAAILAWLLRAAAAAGKAACHQGFLASRTAYATARLGVAAGKRAVAARSSPYRKLGHGGCFCSLKLGAKAATVSKVWLS